jgi:malate synthase
MEEFAKVLGPRPNQIDKKRDDVNVSASVLLDFQPERPITESGLRMNINVGIQYLSAWLAGHGAVPIHNLMEDAATAEISRAQIWQWMRSPKGVLEDGRKVTQELFLELLREELAKIRAGEVDAVEGKFEEGAKLFEQITLADDFVEFLTLPAYEQID